MAKTSAGRLGLKAWRLRSLERGDIVSNLPWILIDMLVALRSWRVITIFAIGKRSKATSNGQLITFHDNFV